MLPAVLRSRHQRASVHTYGRDFPPSRAKDARHGSARVSPGKLARKTQNQPPTLLLVGTGSTTIEIGHGRGSEQGARPCASRGAPKPVAPPAAAPSILAHSPGRKLWNLATSACLRTRRREP